MSFDDYVHHLKQKYSLAVAIAVIKSKPANLTNEAYIQKLRNQIKPNKMEIDGLNISLCSDDFDLNDETKSQNNDTYVESQETNFSPTILGDFNFDDNIQQDYVPKSDSIADTLSLLKAIDRDTICDQQNNKIPQNTFNPQYTTRDSESYFENILDLEHNYVTPHVDLTKDTHNANQNSLKTIENKYISREKTVIDSQNTTSYTISDIEHNTYVTQSQAVDQRFEIKEKYIIGVRKPRTTSAIVMDINTTEVNANGKGDKNEKHEDLDETQINAEQTIEMGRGNNEINESEINDSLEEFDSQTDNAIPFKIVEELNTIKAAFRRNETRLSGDSSVTDSGFLSESQIKSTFRSGLQSQGNLNQSAHCLFTYLMNCPLVCNTLDIADEISKVLGDLVDKLHAEEIYPAFLDEVLEQIKSLLEQILNDSTSGFDDTSQNKDVCVHRLLLLNRSLHIITYTIDKIAAILESFHKELTTDKNLYEITNIAHTENICYIFHVLEMLIQRYVKKKSQFASLPSSQISEDERLPRKSSITDIWRKKWDPDYKKREKIECSTEPINLGSQIGDILNKLIVDCMDGYSLISYAALQSFNLLQS